MVNSSVPRARRRAELSRCGIARRLRRRSFGLVFGIFARRYLWAPIVDEQSAATVARRVFTQHAADALLGR
jgi:hypothetical protein